MQLQEILKKANKDGFTEILKWTLKRYVIWLTHNENPTLEELKNQIESFYCLENITVGGWISQEWIKYIDIGTCTDSLEEARLLQKFFRQIAIFDLVECKDL
jgi:hypothetical protein